MTTRERVKTRAIEYWVVHPKDRSKIYGWLEEHVLSCDASALVLENEAQAWSKSTDLG